MRHFLYSSPYSQTPLTNTLTHSHIADTHTVAGVVLKIKMSHFQGISAVEQLKIILPVSIFLAVQSRGQALDKLFNGTLIMAVANSYNFSKSYKWKCWHQKVQFQLRWGETNLVLVSTTFYPLTVNMFQWTISVTLMKRCCKSAASQALIKISSSQEKDSLPFVG